MSQNKKVLRSRPLSFPRSPARQVKKPVLTPNQLQKKEKRERFHREVSELVKQRKQLTRLSERFAKAKPGHNLVFHKDQEVRVLTRTELNLCFQEYDKKLIGLNKLSLEMS